MMHGAALDHAEIDDIDYDVRCIMNSSDTEMEMTVDEIFIIGCTRIVKMTTSGTTNDENFIKMTSSFQWM